MPGKARNVATFRTDSTDSPDWLATFFAVPLQRSPRRRLAAKSLVYVTSVNRAGYKGP